ncbi:hypothetical protein Tco_0651877 [Tanacetum coccineum]|uniref:Uncharacterized protein n=1 Tax=Tanacetum coccineum TaxID=301880 RepID=A0ABQ4WW96_9ASTR
MLYEALKEMLPLMFNKEAIQKECENLCAEVISQVNDVIANHIPPRVDSFLWDYMSNNILHITFEKITAATSCRPSAIRPRDHDNYQDDDSRPKGENSAKRQKMLEYGT